MIYSNGSYLMNRLLYMILCLVITTTWLMNYYVFDGSMVLGVVSGSEPWFAFMGSVFAVVSHASWGHYLSNMFMLAMCYVFLTRYLSVAQYVMLTLSGIFGTGFIAWQLDVREFGEAIHIGSSGLIWAYMVVALLFTFRYLKSKLLSKIETGLYYCLFLTTLLGVGGLFPADDMISWQMHLGGLIIGLFFTVYLIHNRESATLSLPLFSKRKIVNASSARVNYIVGAKVYNRCSGRRRKSIEKAR